MIIKEGYHRKATRVWCWCSDGGGGDNVVGGDSDIGEYNDKW